MSASLDPRKLQRLLGISALLVVAASAALGFLILRGSAGLAKLSADLTVDGAQRRAHDVERFKGEVAALAKIPSTVSAFQALEKGYSAYIPSHLRDMYVALNPHQGEDLSRLTDTRDGSSYGEAHAEHHAWLREVSRAEGFDDLFLVRPDGHVIYSVRKGRTFATRVGEGEPEAAVREFARVAREVTLKRQGGVEISSEVLALLGGRDIFAATALINAEGACVGALVVQRPAWQLGADPGVLSLNAVKNEWETAAKLATSGLALVAFLLLGGFVLLGARRDSKEQQLGLPLVPVKPLPAEIDSGRPASHRSGTRPVLASMDPPPPALGKQASRNS